RPRPLVHKCPLCINTDRKFWALGFVAMCHKRLLAIAAKQTIYSITSSARASNVGGTSRSNALAVLRLMTSAYLVGFCTGISATLAPLRIYSTQDAARR